MYRHIPYSILWFFHVWAWLLNVTGNIIRFIIRFKRCWDVLLFCWRSWKYGIPWAAGEIFGIWLRTILMLFSVILQFADMNMTTAAIIKIHCQVRIPKLYLEKMSSNKTHLYNLYFIVPDIHFVENTSPTPHF